MEAEVQVAIDVILFILAAAFSLVSTGYIAMLWSLRRNFFIILRSPRLACALGLLSTLHYLASMYEFTISTTKNNSATKAEIATFISFPAIIAAEMALIMTAVRLLVMYYPSERARWGRFTKEIPLTCGLACGYVSIEIALWSVAWSQDLTSVAAMVKTLQPSSAVVAVVGAVGLSGRLRKVDDAGSMSRDIRFVGAFMLGGLCLLAAATIAPIPSPAGKYCSITFVSILHPVIVWISIIRPVRAVVRDIPEKRRSTVEILLVSPHRKHSSTSIAVTADFEPTGGPRKKKGSCDDNRLSSIMNFLPLREAFGEYCRKFLCSESFQFLQDVCDFQADLVDAALVGEEKDRFKGFGGFLAIVNDYIKAGSHSEVNLESRTKSDIQKYSKFKAYALLDLEERKEIFSAATTEIGKILVDNLFNKFLVSAQYKAVVDFESDSQA